jgi:hypothetical protein
MKILKSLNLSAIKQPPASQFAHHAAFDFSYHEQYPGESMRFRVKVLMQLELVPEFDFAFATLQNLIFVEG